MFEIRNNLENNKIFIAIISLFSLFRLYLGMKMPIWIFSTSFYDDLLMFEYSHLNTHFNFWNIQSLSKDIAYSIFLFFVRLSHISYRFWLSLFWIIAALLVIYALYKFLTKDKLILLGSFLFVLFLPVGFDILCGQRVYRNGILAPTAIIFLSMLYIFINKILESKIDVKNTIIWGVLLGLTFTFNYYIKEDGILTLPILVVCILAVILFKLYDETKFSFSKPKLKKFAKISIICIIPLLIFVAGTFTYQEVNNHYFGVSEINTRTSGEIGEFYANLLKIDDPNKNTRIWIPASTVEKAASASPTLKAHPEFVNGWLNTTWGTGILKNSTIPGDLTEWSLRQALKNTGIYKDEKTASEFFAQVNDELDLAFENGQLQKSDEIFITSSANGKDINEIMALAPHILSGMKMTFLYDGLEFNNVNQTKTSLVDSNGFTQNASRDINDNFATQTELDHLSSSDSIPINLIHLDLGIYKIISYVLAILSFAGFLLICKNRSKNRKLNMLALFCIMLIGTVLVQIFAVSWFCSYLGTNHWVGSMDDLTTHIKFHLTSAYGFFTMFVVFSISGTYTLIRDNDSDKANSIGLNSTRPSREENNIQQPKQTYKPQQTQNNIQQPKQTYKPQQTQNNIQHELETYIPPEPVEIDIDSIDDSLIEEILKEIKMEKEK